MTEDSENAGVAPLAVRDGATDPAAEAGDETQAAAGSAPTTAQLKWLARGLSEPGGKLPLFDRDGQRVSARTVESCIKRGWAAPWFNNPLKPDWLVCKLTEAGRAQAEAAVASDAAGAAAKVVPLRR